MSKSLALLFAIIGTLLLAAISLFISLRLPWMAIISSLIALLFIGYGFALKVKIRNKHNR